MPGRSDAAELLRGTILRGAAASGLEDGTGSDVSVIGGMSFEMIDEGSDGTRVEVCWIVAWDCEAPLDDTR